MPKLIEGGYQIAKEALAVKHGKKLVALQRKLAQASTPGQKDEVRQEIQKEESDYKKRMLSLRKSYF